MHNIVLIEIVQAYQYLDGKPLDQVQGEALEMIHLDELIQIDREDLERDHQMLSEDELVESPDNIFLVFRILVVEVLDQLCLNQTLFVETLFVFQYFQGNILALLMVVAFEDHSEAAFAELLGHLISIVEMLVQSGDVLITLSVESIVGRLIEDSHL